LKIPPRARTASRKAGAKVNRKKPSKFKRSSNLPLSLETKIAKNLRAEAESREKGGVVLETDKESEDSVREAMIGGEIVFLTKRDEVNPVLPALNLVLDRVATLPLEYSDPLKL
jgi:hypothetical protein